MERLLHRYFRTLARYNAWANAQLYEVYIGFRDPDDESRNAQEQRSLYRVLNARLAADKRWLARLQGYTPESAGADEDQYDEIETLRDAQLAEDVILTEHVNRLSEEDLLRPITYLDDAGEMHTNAQYELLTQLATEQIETRARAAALMTTAGAAQPDLSMLVFFRTDYAGTHALSV